MSDKDLISKESIILRLENSDKNEAIKEIIQKATVFKGIQDINCLINAVFTRERVQNTGFGHGVAVAHGKFCGVPGIHIALGISEEGINYGSCDGKPVHFLFVIASSPDKQNEYLYILSRIARHLKNDTFRNTLQQCSCTDEAFALISTAFASMQKTSVA
ncbi:MAG: PTS sugar transporter subunit IIA [Spirochaetia bacterium]